MAIYILTDNQFLFLGIERFIYEKMKLSCTLLNPDESRLICKIADKDDIFIVLYEYLCIDFSNLMALHSSDATVIIAKSNFDWKVIPSLGFHMLAHRFSVQELLDCLRAKSVTRNKIKHPTLSCKEKTILMLTVEGLSTSVISEQLCMPTKTVYTYQRNIYSKIGVRKAVDISHIPGNYIEYISSAHEQKVSTDSRKTYYKQTGRIRNTTGVSNII